MAFHTSTLARNYLRNLLHRTRDDRPPITPAPWDVAPSLGGRRRLGPPVFRHMPQIPEYLPPSIEKAELLVAAAKALCIEDADVNSAWARKRRTVGTDVLVLPKKRKCHWKHAKKLAEEDKKARALSQLREIVE